MTMRDAHGVRPGRPGPSATFAPGAVRVAGGVSAVALALTVLTGCATAPTPISSGVPPVVPSPSGPTLRTSSPTPTVSLLPPSPAPASSTEAQPTEPATSARPGPVKGVDVSRWQRSVNWKGLTASGHRFAYVKATEGTTHRSPTYRTQWAGARAQGLLTGAYHYARPAASSGASQATFFVANGGRWTPDGRTLPGALDLEAAEKGDPCHGLSKAAMQRWVRDYSDTYRKLTGRRPVIYVKAELWNRCVSASDFSDHPLWLYDHDAPMGPLPQGWTRPTLWQYGVQSNLDRNHFLGSEAELAAWAAQSG